MLLCMLGKVCGSLRAEAVEIQEAKGLRSGGRIEDLMGGAAFHELSAVEEEGFAGKTSGLLEIGRAHV